jgi:excinuclease UvrABC nuclease subunit
MKKSKFLPLYYPSGKTTFNTSQRPGVYLIKENNIVVYIGYSAYSIYKTMYRHFQAWTHKQQQVVTYKQTYAKNYTARLIYCTPKQAISLERTLILKYKPRDNENKYQNYSLNFEDKKNFENYVGTQIEEAPF